jgi:hypothetical protein
MLDPLGPSMVGGFLMPLDLAQSGVEGEDLPVAVSLGKTSETLTRPGFGGEVEVELDTLDVARAVKGSKLRRPVGRALVNFDPGQRTFIVRKKFRDLVTAFQGSQIPGSSEMVAPVPILKKKISHPLGVCLGQR